MLKEIAQLWSKWNLAGPWQLTLLRGGANNRVWRAISANGQHYVLRLYQDTDRIEQIKFEHTLLLALAEAELSFQLPSPVVTYTGETLLTLDEVATPTLVSLWHYLPGAYPSLNRETALWAGAALGELTTALACLQEEGPDSIHNDLRRVHLLIPEPLTVLVEIVELQSFRDKLEALFENLLVEMPTLLTTLPYQLTHGDYDPSNILVNQKQVSSVLDFEFCGYGLRVMDLANSIFGWWQWNATSRDENWERVRALVRGYARHIKLTEAELEAVATLLQQRAAVSLVYRLGRYRAGLDRWEAVEGRIKGALTWDKWVREHNKILREILAAEFRLPKLY